MQKKSKPRLTTKSVRFTKETAEEKSIHDSQDEKHEVNEPNTRKDQMEFLHELIQDAEGMDDIKAALLRDMGYSGSTISIGDDGGRMWSDGAIQPMANLLEGDTVSNVLVHEAQ